MLNKLKIISRNSALAMWQANHVKELLMANYPQLEVEIIGITTAGDRILDKSLDKIGGKGLFIKELEQQLLDGRADIAVHSLKDLPANLPAGFTLAAVLARENPYDALVSNNYSSLAELPAGAVIGTSSARRMAILRRDYPQLTIKMLRGNLQTRIAKLDGGEYDAIILAVAGLKRLGLQERIRQVLPAEQFIPAIGQGVLGIEISSQRHELLELLQPLHDGNSAAMIGAEREMGRYLNASCNIPLAGFAWISAGELTLTALLADSQRDVYLNATATGAAGDYLQIGQDCARVLINAGALAVIERLKIVTD